MLFLAVPPRLSSVQTGDTIKSRIINRTAVTESLMEAEHVLAPPGSFVLAHREVQPGAFHLTFEVQYNRDYGVYPWFQLPHGT